MISSDTEIKVMIAVVGIVSSLIGALVAVGVFFWKEGRSRYLEQLGDLRTVLIMTEVIKTGLRLNPDQKPALEPEWFVEHSASILHKEHWFGLAQELIHLTVKAQSTSDDESLSNIVQDLESLKLKAEIAIRKHTYSLKRLVLFV